MARRPRLAPLTQTATLSDSNPTFNDYAGDPNNYQTVTLHVPRGEDRLNASAAFQGRDLTDLNSRVRFFLIDPTGKYAGHGSRRDDRTGAVRRLGRALSVLRIGEPVVRAPEPRTIGGGHAAHPNPDASATNMVPSSSDASGQTNVIGAQVHVLNPAAGKWTLIVVFAPAVSGTALSEPFTVAVNQDAVSAGAGGLPNSTQTILTAGHAYPYNATIKNTGTAPESFFPDARLPGSTPFQLGARRPAAIPTSPPRSAPRRRRRSPPTRWPRAPTRFSS